MNSIGKQTIITILAGQQAPLEVLKLMLDKKPKQFGFSVQGVEDGEPEFSVMRTEDIPTLENLTEMNINTKPYHVQMYFGFLEGTVDSRNIQPFLLTDANDVPYMTVMCEGVFSKYNEPTNQTEELNVFDKIVASDIMNILDLTEGSLEKLNKHLSGERFNETFLSNTDHRGILHILPLTGDPILLAKNELGETYDWGYMSQKHGFGDVAQEPKKSEGKQTGWWKKSKTAEPVAETKTSVPTVKASETKETKEVKAVRPPSWLHGNNDIKAWYMAVHGAIISNWKKRLPVTVVNEVPEWKDLKDFQSWCIKQKATAPAETSTSAKVDAGTTLTELIEAKVEEGLGILLNKKQLEKALDYVSKHLDGQSQEIPDPKTIQGTESKVPTLSETLAFDKESYLNWPKAALFKFFNEHPTAAALAFIEVRDMLRPHIKVAAKEKVVTTSEKSGEGTTKTESVVVPEKTEAKTGSWWKKKKVA